MNKYTKKRKKVNSDEFLTEMSLAYEKEKQSDCMKALAGQTLNRNTWLDCYITLLRNRIDLLEKSSNE